MTFALPDQVALVSGASRGTGGSLAPSLAEVGADLVLVGRSSALAGVAEEVASRGLVGLPPGGGISREDEVDGGYSSSWSYRD